MSQVIQQIVNLAMNMPYTIQIINLWSSKCEIKKKKHWQVRVGHTWGIKQFPKFQKSSLSYILQYQIDS